MYTKNHDQTWSSEIRYHTQAVALAFVITEADHVDQLHHSMTADLFSTLINQGKVGQSSWNLDQNSLFLSHDEFFQQFETIIFHEKETDFFIMYKFSENMNQLFDNITTVWRLLWNLFTHDLDNSLG